MTGLTLNNTQSATIESKNSVPSKQEQDCVPTEVLTEEGDIRRTLIQGYMDILISKVQDRVLTDLRVLDYQVPASDLLEKAVWGIDSHTRYNIEWIIQELLPNRVTMDELTIFIEKKLLPSINAQPPHCASDITFALKSIINVSNI